MKFKKITFNEWKDLYLTCKREFWHLSLLLFIFIVFPFRCVCGDGRVSQIQNFENAINKYEKEYGKKIYPYGKKCLLKATQNMNTEEEIFEFIVKEMEKQ